MNNAERAANFLVMTNQHPEDREDFSSIFTPHTQSTGDFVGLGNYYVFTDKSALFALHSPIGTTLLCTDEESAPADLLQWAHEEEKLPELFTALTAWLQEATDAAE